MSVNNTKYGSASLNSNSGSNNTAVGAYAAYNNLDGFNNTAVGSNSSYYNTTGVNNTALGAGSLCNNETGSLNTAVGSSALEGVVGSTTGDQNVAIGAQALYVNSGNLNTAIGTYAGENVNSSYNTFLGANTTFDNINATYEYSTAIGYNAGITGSNQVMIGGTGPLGFPDVVIPGNGYLPNFNISLPLTPDQIVPKAYIDAVAQGLAARTPCQCIAYADVTITGGNGLGYIDVTKNSSSNNYGSTPFTIDGFTAQPTALNPNIRVLISNQQVSSPGPGLTEVYNGIYDVSYNNISGPYWWVRSSDMVDGDDALGAFCFIQYGNLYQATNFIQSTTVSTVPPSPNPPSDYIIVGQDPLNFVLYSSFSYLAGRGLELQSYGSDTYIQVDTSLNFINFLDSVNGAPQPGGATGGSGTLNIGTSGTTNVIIGPTGPSFGNPVQFPSGLTGATGSFTNVYASGNIGIQNSNPGNTLDVSGNLNVDGFMNGVINNPGFNFLPLDISSNFAQNWSLVTSFSGIVLSSVAVSASGQYQTAVGTVSGGGTNAGNIYISNNYGVTWILVTGSFPSSFTDVAVSASGQYQTAVISNLSASANVYISSSYGVTWTPIQAIGASQEINSVSMSASGQYQTLADSDGSGDKFLYYSTNYGQTWNQSNSPQDSHTAVSLSSSGQYQTSTAFPTGNIYTSSNYGLTFATNVGTGAFTTVSISASGQYQSGINNNSGGTIYINSTYGVGAWTPVNEPASGYSSISVSASGQYQVAVTSNGAGIYYSTDYGVNWRQSSTGITDSFSSVSISASGQYITATSNSGGTGNIYTSVIPVTSLTVSGLLSAAGGITGPTGSFQNVTVSGPATINGLLSAPGGITGTTGSFTYLSADLTGLTGASKWNSNGNNIYNNNTGNVGIGFGNTNPSFTLDVSGNARITGGITGPTGSFTHLTVAQNTTLGSTGAQTSLGTSFATLGTSSPSGNWSMVSTSSDGSVTIGLQSGATILNIYQNGVWSTSAAPSGPSGSPILQFAASTSCQYIVVRISGGSLYYSTNYGSTWTSPAFASSSTFIAISGDGSYVFTNETSGSYTYIYSGFNSTSGSFTTLGRITPSASSQAFPYFFVTPSGSLLGIGQNPISYYTQAQYDVGGGLGPGYLAPSYTSNMFPSSLTMVDADLTGQYQVGILVNGGIYYSQNSGSNWAPSDVPTTTVFTSISMGLGGDICVACSGNGFYLSTNYGANWNLTYPFGSTISSVSISGDETYAVASPSSSGQIQYSTTSGGVNLNYVTNVSGSLNISGATNITGNVSTVGNNFVSGTNYSSGLIVNSNSYSILSSSRSLTGSTGNYPRYPLNTGGITGPSGYTLITPLNLTSNKAEIQNIIEETALIITANTSSGVTNESGSYYTGGYLQGLTGSAFGTVGTFQGVTGSISASPNIYFDTTKTCFYKNVGINLGETGPSFTLDVSGNIRATQGITGPTGSFTYLSASQGITGPTGSFQSLNVNGNVNVSGYISSGGVYWYGGITGPSQTVATNNTAGIILSTTAPLINSFNSTGVTTATGFTVQYPGSGTTTTNPIIVPTGAYGVYSVTININLDGASVSTPNGTVQLIICQTTSSGVVKSYALTETYVDSILAGDTNVTPTTGLFQYTQANQGNYFSFIFANSSGATLGLDVNGPYSNVQLYKVA